ncbi:ABC transporter permease subunit, partial [Proteus mirabilis]|uniref:ABC transporter permease subunit n=2 Tax=Gammaproteobacteria TaxID=1236 RepID=UPI003CC7A352
SMGIRATRVDIMTFALGSGVAGLAGVALSQLTNVGPNLGQNYIIDSFMVVVFGGVGNLWGTLVAGLSLGIINQVLEPWAGAV